MTVPRITLADDPAFEHLQRGKERGGAVALVVVGAADRGKSVVRRRAGHIARYRPRHLPIRDFQQLCGGCGGGRGGCRAAGAALCAGNLLPRIIVAASMRVSVGGQSKMEGFESTGTQAAISAHARLNLL